MLISCYAIFCSPLLCFDLNRVLWLTRTYGATVTRLLEVLGSLGAVALSKLEESATNTGQWPAHAKLRTEYSKSSDSMPDAMHIGGAKPTTRRQSRPATIFPRTGGQC